MKIGKYSLKIIESGFFGLDGGAMFGIIPKVLWQTTNPPDSENRIRLATRNLLLESGKRKILIDTGMGNKWSSKLKVIYSISEGTSVEAALLKHQIEPEDITDVILTHFHFDHTGGSTKNENGKIVPTFPNAKYFVQKQNFDWAMNPSDRDKGSYLKENFESLYIDGVLNFINGEEDFDDEIKFIVVNGHAFGQQLIKISDSSNTFLYCCDLFPTVSHIPIPYVMGYDLQPLITVSEKQKILKQAIDENWKLFFEHDPDIAFVTLKATDKGIRADEKFEDF
jgi:glyoxylase-like metal-dependent hydrolase (beta-lactamase superfamily II)